MVKNQAIESFPVFLEGDLKESLLKDITLNFFESLPSVLTLALQAKIPPAQIHFINSDLKNKIRQSLFSGNSEEKAHSVFRD